MTLTSLFSSGPALMTRRLLILVLAGLLVFHHSVMLGEALLDLDSHPPTLFDVIQWVLRVAIASSLLLVVWGRPRALWGMWISIGGLVATQYWAHFGELPVEFTRGRHPLSYLKGFIFPTLITLAFPHRRLAARPPEGQGSKAR
ncbi:hypothetical protein H5407_19000 [Mitsuaria sp. WAJ17]|uniref:hypothetical protein n=1 Tax=Mitsuaria sp. WAJ17 TaxID=2761452 RepID=UPI001603DE6B|nr:hypothetical protein [Mitsuaria sp. WAJ17]MBB2487328.1 hypothetical protein [Mitsuaria sp. WAJ17]